MTAQPASAGTRFHFAVTTARAEVAAFAQALGFGTAGEAELRVPLTYPMRWLAADEVQRWLVDALGGGSLPVHEMQDFTYHAPLAIDRTYAFDVVCSHADAARITLTAEIRDGDALIGTSRASILKVQLGAP